MGGSWLEVCVTHCPGHAIIFVDCCDCPEFLNTERFSTGSQCKFLRTRVILFYLLVLDIILTALFPMLCSLDRLNRETEK